MFTGLIEELGTLTGLTLRSAGLGRSARLRVQAKATLRDLAIGDSIAVNGVCLTATAVGSSWFEADAMPETVTRTNLCRLKKGDRVNLERAVRADSRLGGHVVTGHVDAVGTILERRQTGIAVIFSITCPRQLCSLITPKGSVALDGISLTVVSVHGEGFTVSVIPHTLAHTTLKPKQPGALVNIEADTLARYVARLAATTGERTAGATARDTSGSAVIDKDKLMTFGFL